MTFRLLPFLFLLSSIKLMAQADSANPVPQEVSEVVEQMPEPPYDLNRYLSTNIRYPNKAIKAGISGTVIVGFTVQLDGNITDVHIVKGVGYGLDEEAMRVVREMPPWIAGKISGQLKATIERIPIRFRLTGDEGQSSMQDRQDTLSETKLEPISKITPGHTNKGYYYPDRNAEAPYDVEAFFLKNMRYPERARLHRVDGTVVVHFAVDIDGKISDATLGKGIGYGCDEEAVRLVSLMPPWKPALKGGKPVIMFYRVPVVFTLPK